MHEMDQDKQMLVDERELHNQRQQGRREIQVRAVGRSRPGKDAGSSGLGGRVEKNGRGEKQ